MVTTGYLETNASRDRRNRGRRSVELDEHPHDGGAFLGILVMAEPTRVPVQEREKRDRVPRPDPKDRVPIAGADRRDHERKAALAECNGGLERAAQTVVHLLPRVPEPGLLIEVVHGREAGRSLTIADDPVIAAAADGRVVGALGVETPAIGQ
jgi:hypothetical protein